MTNKSYFPSTNANGEQYSFDDYDTDPGFADYFPDEKYACQDMHPYQDSEPVFPKLPPWNNYQHHVENFINPTVKEGGHTVRCTIAALGLCGESGEVADHIKKHVEQGHPFSLGKVKEELGDVLFYVAAMCNANDLSMDEVMNYNVAKLTKRYPNGFSTEASLNREK